MLFNGVLVSPGDYGFTPTTLAARLTYRGASDAMAAGLLGGGSVLVGPLADTATGKWLPINGAGAAGADLARRTKQSEGVP